MAKKSKITCFTLEKYIKDCIKFIRIDRDFWKECNRNRDYLLDFCHKIENNEIITVTELKIAHKRCAQVCGFLGDYLTQTYKSKEAVQDELDNYFLASVSANKALLINAISNHNCGDKLVRDLLQDTPGFIYRIIHCFELFALDYAELYDSYDDKETLLNIYADAIEARVMFSEEQQRELCDVMESLYCVNPRTRNYDVNELVYVYNKFVFEQKLNQKKALMAKAVKAKEEVVIEVDPYEERIRAIETYPNVSILDTIPGLDKKIVLDNLDLTQKITTNDYKELEMLLCQSKKVIYDAFIAYGTLKRKLFYTLLFRAYINKNMTEQIKELAYMIPDIEMKKFDYVEFLTEHNMNNDLVLYNNYRAFLYELSQNKYENIELYDKLNEQLEAFETLIYCYATGLYDEKDYLTELQEYLVSYENMAASYHFENTNGDEVNELLNNNDENIVVLLTDDDGISYAEKDLRSEITTNQDMNIVYNQLMGIKSINVHEVDPHKFKTDCYSEAFLKNLHFKSLKKQKTRFFYGKFANSEGESMVLIYGVHHGAMDFNDKDEYGKSTLRNCKSEIDKINMIIDAFTNRSVDPERFNQILDNNDAALKRIEKLANGEALKLEN